MKSSRAIVNYYLGKFLEGHMDDGFHGLIESDEVIIPELMHAFKSTHDIATRAFLVDVISEFRSPKSIGFLRHALVQQESKIWQKALDGLVLVPSSESLNAMDYVHSSVIDEKKRSWIDEAISDMKAAVYQKSEPDGRPYDDSATAPFS